MTISATSGPTPTPSPSAPDAPGKNVSRLARAMRFIRTADNYGAGVVCLTSQLPGLVREGVRPAARALSDCLTGAVSRRLPSLPALTGQLADALAGLAGADTQAQIAAVINIPAATRLLQTPEAQDLLVKLLLPEDAPGAEFCRWLPEQVGRLSKTAEAFIRAGLKALPQDLKMNDEAFRELEFIIRGALITVRAGENAAIYPFSRDVRERACRAFLAGQVPGTTHLPDLLPALLAARVAAPLDVLPPLLAGRTPEQCLAGAVPELPSSSAGGSTAGSRAENTDRPAATVTPESSFIPSDDTAVGMPDRGFSMPAYDMLRGYQSGALRPGLDMVLVPAGTSMSFGRGMSAEEALVCHLPVGQGNATSAGAFPGGATVTTHAGPGSSGRMVTEKRVTTGSEPLLFAGLLPGDNVPVRENVLQRGDGIVKMDAALPGRPENPDALSHPWAGSAPSSAEKNDPSGARSPLADMARRAAGAADSLFSSFLASEFPQFVPYKEQLNGADAHNEVTSDSVGESREDKTESDFFQKVQGLPGTDTLVSNRRVGRTLKSYPVNNRFSDGWEDDMRNSPRERMRERTSSTSKKNVVPVPPVNKSNIEHLQIVYPPPVKRQGVIHDGAQSLITRDKTQTQQVRKNAALTTEKNAIVQPPEVKDPDVPPGMQEILISPEDSPSCQTRAFPSETQGLNDMIDRVISWADRYLALEDRKKRVKQFAARFSPLQGYSTELSCIVAVCDKLMEDNSSHINLMMSALFVEQFFEHSGFENDPAFINAFIRSPQGKGMLARVLLNVFDDSLPDKGILLKQIDNTFKNKLDPLTTTYAMLPGILSATLDKFKKMLLDMGGANTEESVAFSQKIINKLTLWVQKYLEYSWPFLKLRNSLNISNQRILDEKGLMRIIAMRVRFGNNISDNERTQIGMHLFLGLDKEKIVREHHHLDKIYAENYMHNYMEYLQSKTELLVRHLFLESSMRRLINHPKNKEQDIRQNRSELRQNTLKLYTLALKKLSTADQSILKSATGIKFHVIHMEKIVTEDAVHITERFWFGFSLTANLSNNNEYGWFISAVPASNDITQPLIFKLETSDIFGRNSRGGEIISFNRKKKFLNMLPVSQLSDMASYQFKVDAGRDISYSGTEEWSVVATDIARQVVNAQFPDTTALVTAADGVPALSAGVDLLINLTPFGACRDVADDLRNSHGAIITLLDAFKCLYSLAPGGAEEEAVVNILYRAGGSILNGVIEKFRTKKLQQQTSQLHIESVKDELEPGVVHDSRILYHLANSKIYRPSLSNVLLQSSLNFTQLPGGFNLSSARLNKYSGEIYCKLNTPYQQREYKLDTHCQHLIPVSSHQNTTQSSWVNLAVAPLKLACKSQDNLDAFIRQNLLNDRNGEIHFTSTERPAVPDDGEDIVLNNLDLEGVPADWSYQKTWVKKGCGIITSWKDAQGSIRYKQVDVGGNWRVWQPDTSNHTRPRRDVTPLPSLYTNVLAPMEKGFVELLPYNNPDRKLALERLKIAFTNTPKPHHAELMEFRCFVRNELIPKLPSDFHWSNSLIKFCEGEELHFQNFIKYAEKYIRQVKIQENATKETLDFITQLEPKIIELTGVAQKIKNLNTALKTLNELRDSYYEKYIKPEQIALTQVNRILYSIKNIFSNSVPNFYLKTHSENEMKKRYPEMHNRIFENLSELHRDAHALSLSLNKVENTPSLMLFMNGFFGKNLSNSDVVHIKNHINAHHEKLFKISVGNFRVIEDRRLKESYSQNLLPDGCLASGLEKLLYGTGVVALTNKDSGYKKIYIKPYLEDADLLRSVMVHETIHTYLAPAAPLFRLGEEVYIDSGNITHKFSFYGLSSMASKLLSDKKELQIHILKNRSELSAFCQQVYKMAGESGATELKEMINKFWRQFMSNKSIHHYRMQSTERFAAFTPIMERVYQNSHMMLGFVLANPDFLAGLWFSLKESARTWPQPSSSLQGTATGGITAGKALCLWIAGIDEYSGRHARPVD